jgi:hypothetical protein
MFLVLRYLKHDELEDFFRTLKFSRLEGWVLVFDWKTNPSYIHTLSYIYASLCVVPSVNRLTSLVARRINQ